LAHVKHKKGLIKDGELQDIIAQQEQCIDQAHNYKLTMVKIDNTTPEAKSVDLQKPKKKYINVHDVYGHIYCVTSPSGKQYIGSSHLLFFKENNNAIFSQARKYKYKSFNDEVKKYGEDKMKVEIVASCKKDQLEQWQNYFIDLFETREPKGLNTRLTVSSDVKQKISETLKNNVIRIDADGKELPKYVKYIDWSDRKGYAIVSHPNCKLKYFVSKKKDLKDLYDKCMAYLTGL
jgi:hypothetical protein